jgi:hypothetical protein
VPERRTDPRGHRLRGGQTGDDPHRHAGELGALGDLEHRRGHREDARVAGGHDGDPPSLLGQLERVPRPLGLHPVVAGVPPLPGVGRHAGQVRAVADQVVGGGQHVGRLGRGPAPVAGTEADDGDLAAV